MYPSWVSQNTCPIYTSGTNKTNLSHSYQGVQVLIQTWTPSPHTWVPDSIRCLDLHPKATPKVVGPKRAGTHDKRVTSLPAPISKYVLRTISLWPDYHPQQRTVLNQHRRNECNQSLARLPNPIQIQIQSIVPSGPQLLSIHIPCDDNCNNNIFSYLSWVIGNHSTSTEIL